MGNILGIDVGYGHVKWVAIDDTGEVKTAIFPSVAPITSRERTVETNGMTGLRTVTVNIGQHNYAVGRDAFLETDANYCQSRLPDFSQTDRYRALMLGALSMSGLKDIDHLVIGLPLTTLANYHSNLQSAYLGDHLIGSTYARRKVEITVRNVHVSSQPAGAMIHAVSVNPQLRKTTNLILDMGYFTMDFLMCEGLRPFYARSGAIEGGMSGYFDHLGGIVLEQLSELGVPRQTSVDHFRLERSISRPETGPGNNEIYSLQIGNKTVNITESVEKSKTKLNEYLDRMLSALGTGSLDLINTVVLAGGGGKFIQSAVQARIGHDHEFMTLDNSQFAIAQGYAQLGLAAARRAASAA